MSRWRRTEISRRHLLGGVGLTGIGWLSPKLVRESNGATVQPIDLDQLRGVGVYTSRLQHALPDAHGIHLQCQLKSSENLQQAVAYASQWWPAGGNRVYPKILARLEQTPEGALFLLIKKASGRYLALLPLADAETNSWFSGDGRDLFVKLGTLGRGTVDGEKHLFAWAEAGSAYAAIRQAWKHGLAVMDRKSVSLREQKTYPEMFTYLGWCSWEAFGTEINEQKMTAVVRQIEECNVPVRYFLMDEGHADYQTLSADKNKFPNGYRALTDNRKPGKVRWFGLWWGFLGAPHGVKAPGNLGPLSDAMLTCANGVLLPRPNEADAARFFDQVLNVTHDGGFDFIKIDFMVDALPLYAGVKEEVPTLGGLPPDNKNAIANPFAAAAMLMRVCEQRVAKTLRGIMNCNWHSAACLFNSGASAVGRCSEDYKSNQLDRAKAHLYHAFSAIPWLGQIAWGDHDMFHSSDRVAALPMAISKAISGGPVYLSDKPTDFAKELIEPLCYADGLLLRPTAPGAPVEEDIFYTPDGGKLLRIIAPINFNAAAVAIFHLETKDAALSTSITLKHYQQATGMMQPHLGDLPTPADGVLVYDCANKHATQLQQQYVVTRSIFGVTLLQLSPIQLGWSVIGRIDKYLPAAAISGIEYAKDTLRLRLVEHGPVAIWSANGMPHMEGEALQQIGENLFVVNLKPGTQEIVLHR